MADLPRITVAQWAETQRAVRIVLQSATREYPPTLKRPFIVGGGGVSIRSAKLVSRAALGSTGARWAYTCRLGKVTTAGAWVEDSPQTTIVAWNKFELTVVTQLSGIQPDGVDQRTAAGYPQTFRLIGVGGGTNASPGNLSILSVWQEALSDGTAQWWFDRVLAHFGECP
jgi:hypothetical protein